MAETAGTGGGEETGEPNLRSYEEDEPRVAAAARRRLTSREVEDDDSESPTTASAENAAVRLAISGAAAPAA